MQYGPIASQRPLFFKAASRTAAMNLIVAEFEIDMEKYLLHAQKLGRTSKHHHRHAFRHVREK